MWKRFMSSMKLAGERASGAGKRRGLLSELLLWWLGGLLLVVLVLLLLAFLIPRIL